MMEQGLGKQMLSGGLSCAAYIFCSESFSFLKSCIVAFTFLVACSLTEDQRIKKWTSY